MQSRQGDFAEWHRRRTGEKPFEEGDVIAIDSTGVITRRTTGHDVRMLGIVSRRAVVEVLPPKSERRLFDNCICGIVPVKVARTQSATSQRLLDADGMILVPSGQNDGTAVVCSKARSNVNLGIVLDAQELHSSATMAGSGDWFLVQVVVVSPAETLRHRGSRSLPPVIVALVLVALAIGLLALGLLLWPRDDGQDAYSRHRSWNATTDAMECDTALSSLCGDRLLQKLTMLYQPKHQ